MEVTEQLWAWAGEINKVIFRNDRNTHSRTIRDNFESVFPFFDLPLGCVHGIVSWISHVIDIFELNFSDRISSYFDIDSPKNEQVSQRR